MFSLTERNQSNSLTIRKKIVLYEDYLQIKNAYINLKEKNNKLKREKQKLELLLNQYQSYISDYKTSNNTINLIFKKLENKYKDTYSLLQKRLFNNMTISKIDNFKIQNNKKKKSISEDEYKRNINKFIEIINQLKKEIKTKEELYEKINKEKNEIILKNNSLNEDINKFTSLYICKDSQFNLINICEEKVIFDKNYNKLKIDSKISEYFILKKNKNFIESNFEKNFIISSKCCEYNILKKEKPKEKKINLIIQTKINEISIFKAPSISIKNVKDYKAPLSISSNCLFSIEKIKKENKLISSSKVSEVNIIQKNRIINKLIISPKTCEYNIYYDDKKQLNDKIKINKLKNNINNSSKIKSSNLQINSKINNIFINNKNKSKQIPLEINSKISEIIIKENKIKNLNFEILNQQLSFIHYKTKKENNGKNKERKFKTQKAIIDNYINSINIGFDNIKKYDDYNQINNEKDEDSDNENDKLECEPVPSFILCIQKKENIK